MKKENIIRNTKGQFKPAYKIWSLKLFNEGYVNSHGRFVVRLPGHHRANINGWVLRAIIAYETYHPGEIITQDFLIHHKDENKLNDSRSNLIKIKSSDHTRLHWKGKSRKGQNDYLKNGKDIACTVCGKSIYLTPCEQKEENFCSKTCWYARNKVKVKCNSCGKEFYKFKHRIKDFNFCSHKCMRPKWSKDHPVYRRKNDR